MSPVFIDRLLPARRTITNLVICIQVLFSLWPSPFYAGITLLKVYLTGYVVACDRSMNIVAISLQIDSSPHVAQVAQGFE